MHPILLAGFATLAAGSPVVQTAVGINSDVLAKVRTNLISIATHSWERGTLAETLSEFDHPDLSVFNGKSLPPTPTTTLNTDTSMVLRIANETIAALTPTSSTLWDKDGAVGDPASLGVAVLYANWTQETPSDYYSSHAEKQLNFLLNVAPHSPEGAISHRSEQVQLWADFIYMAPPFIAYYGALQGGDVGKSLLQEAYNQAKQYRAVLGDGSGLWQHILLGSWKDATHWGTGNAWAAAGMLRVLKTITATDVASEFTEQRADLVSWINEILDSSWKYQAPNGTLWNVIDDPTTFADASGTALLAATTYRMAVFTKDTSRIKFADLALDCIRKSIDDDGWLLNAVDPETFHTPIKPGEHTPEGQAFVLLLHAAHKEFLEWRYKH